MFNDHHITTSTAGRSQAHRRSPGEGGLHGSSCQGASRQVLVDPPDRTAEQETDRRPIWGVILDNMKDVPPEEFAKLPKDGAREVDHYLYGHPKRDQ